MKVHSNSQKIAQNSRNFGYDWQNRVLFLQVAPHFGKNFLSDAIFVPVSPAT